MVSALAPAPEWLVWYIRQFGTELLRLAIGRLGTTEPSAGPAFPNPVRLSAAQRAASITSPLRTVGILRRCLDSRATHA